MIPFFNFTIPWGKLWRYPFFQKTEGFQSSLVHLEWSKQRDTRSRAVGLQVCVVPSLPQPAVSTEPWAQGYKNTDTFIALCVAYGFFCNITAELSWARARKTNNA